MIKQLLILATIFVQISVLSSGYENCVKNVSHLIYNKFDAIITEEASKAEGHDVDSFNCNGKGDMNESIKESFDNIMADKIKFCKLSAMKEDGTLSTEHEDTFANNEDEQKRVYKDGFSDEYNKSPLDKCGNNSQYKDIYEREYSSKFNDKMKASQACNAYKNAKAKLTDIKNKLCKKNDGRTIEQAQKCELNIEPEKNCVNYKAVPETIDGRISIKGHDPIILHSEGLNTRKAPYRSKAKDRVRSSQGR